MIFFILLCLLAIFKPVCAQNSDVVVEFFYSETCHSCDEKKPLISSIEQYYGANITLYRRNYGDYKDLFESYGFTSIPAIVVKNETNVTKLTYTYITEENLKETINVYINGSSFNGSIGSLNDLFCLDSPFGQICFDSSELSLPILTIILAGIDSVNPCSFFVLLFLLSLLLHTKSRKRMLLVGGLFIFVSGFIYFLLMVLIMFVFKQIEEQTIIILIGGIVAIIFGILNMKDFFFFKKGPSASISDEKKSKLFSQMRKVIKITSIPALVIATIILAISANMVELVCSLNLPVVYTGLLLTNSLSDLQYILYLIIYNIIYIIPLIILVTIIVITLGRWKLSEWQGRNLKLFSGIMIFSLGLVMLIKPGFLNNMFTVIIILIISIFSSFIISNLWKKLVGRQYLED